MAEEKNYEIKVVEKAFKQLDLYRGTTGPLTYLLVNSNPFNNCQLFTIGAINHLTISNVKEEEVKALLASAISIATMKKLCLLDINRNHVNGILVKLAPFTKRVVYNQPYLSTNSSEMNTVMVEFDLDKIIK